jgi:hypothetical protein
LFTLSLSLTLSISYLPWSGLHASPWDPAAADYAGHKGKTIYVSKKGDNSDGSSWQRAFHSIQAALLALPDNQGGHQIIIRPDTYVEANVYSIHKGAAGAYNLFRGDFDGKLGSGATGWVVLDCGAPGVAVRTDPSKPYGFYKIVSSDQPESGYKSIDWWANFAGPPGTYSWLNFDRWIFRHIYATGGDGAFGLYSMVKDDERKAGTLVVEDCVGIGRFCGALMTPGVGRKDEPYIFRRSYFLNLDWCGDAGGVYVRAHHTSMPDYPDVIFDDCTIVGPDNALQVGYPGFDLYTRVKFKNCRLITLNFSQTTGLPGSGIICCDMDGKYLHVDFEDCTLMGYKLFGKSYFQCNKAQGSGTTDPSFSIKGKARVYVHYDQPVPKGFERLGLWPVEVVNRLAPPSPGCVEHR